MKPEFVACRGCQQQINIIKFSIVCPHREYPKMCRKHNRFHCGNRECQTNLVDISRKEAKNG